MTGAEAALAFRGWDSAADCAPSAEMPRSLWDWDSGRTGPCEAEPHSYSGAFLKGIRGNDNDGRGGESRWLHQAYFAQREPPGRDGKICTIETIERDKIRPVKPSSMAGFAQWSHRAWRGSSSGIRRAWQDLSCGIRRAWRGSSSGIRRAWQDSLVMHDLRGLDGKRAP